MRYFNFTHKYAMYILLLPIVSVWVVQGDLGGNRGIMRGRNSFQIDIGAGSG
jgi:hypothetical protein